MIFFVILSGKKKYPMKKIFALLLVFASLIGYSQNYEFIKTDGIYQFDQYGAIRIDSIIQVDTGSLLYSYRACCNITEEDPVAVDPLISWLGYYIYVDDNAKTHFYNWNRKPIVFHSNYPAEQEWEMYEYRNTDIVKARFLESTNWVEILPDLYDSVKYICFQAYNHIGEPVENYYNYDTLRLSKNFGMLNAVTFICQDINPYKGHYMYSLTGIELNDASYGEPFYFKDIVSSLEVGSKMDFLSESDHKDIIRQIRRTVVDKKLTENYCTYWYYDSILVDGLFQTKQNSSGYRITALPRESVFGLDSIGFQGYIGLYWAVLGDNDYENRYFDFNYWEGEEGSYLDQYVWWIDYWQLNQGESYTFRFIENVGELLVYKGHSLDGDELVYYKNSNEEWGTPFDFSFLSVSNMVSAAHIQIAPNPSNGNFTLSNNSSENIEEILIYNTNGKIVWKQEAQENEQQIDVSFFSTGLYLMKVHLEDGEVISRKLMIQK